MGFRFRKSANIGPLRVNFSKSGVGYSVGGKGFRVTKRADGKTQATASVPGTGIAYTKVSGSSSGKSAGKSGNASGKKKGPVASIVLAVLFLLGLIGCMASGGNRDEPKTPEEPAAAVTESAATSMTQKEDPKEPEQEPPAEKPEELPAAAPEEIPQEQPEETQSETPAEAPQKQPEAPKEETPAAPVEKPAAPAESTPTPEPSPAPSQQNEKTVYVTKTGKRYHYDSSCNGSTYYPSTLTEAKNRGLTPCQKCVG